MPESLGDGLYLTAVGMGVVFFCLAALMLVLLALQKLFPGEEVAESSEMEAAPSAVVTAVAQQSREALASVGLKEQAATHEIPTEGMAARAKVAAMAVATYLAAEQQAEQAAAVDHANSPFQESRDWKTLGRDLSWENQGRRPPPYGRKPSQG